MFVEIPKEIQADIVNYQALQNQLVIIQNQLARMDAEIKSIDEALAALESTEDEFAYKAAGPVLVKERVSVLQKELEERKESLTIKKKSLEKKAQQIQNTLLQLKKKIEATLASQGASNAPTGA
jgi:prefoldin beta subunit